MSSNAPDLSTSPPRSGREHLGRYPWLARLADKVRADQAGTAGEYVAYCELSMSFLERCGVSKDDFDQLIRNGATDADLVSYFDGHVDDAHRKQAGAFVLDEMKDHLDEQDAEEGHALRLGHHP